MRKIFTLFVLLLCLKITKAQFVTIPDVNFVNWLQANVPSAMSGNQMDTTNVAVTTRTLINVQGQGIPNLTGIRYFDSLKVLNCAQNQITSLPVLPNTLTDLVCAYNLLTSLPILPNSITNLGCHDNLITTIPVLPSSLKVIYCNSNQLTALPTLPNSLTNLICSYNLITSLPSLPNSLIQLSTNNNQLTQLPVLPNSLTNIHCGHNLFTSISGLPNSLLHFECGANQLTNLPALPNTLLTLSCDSNQLTSLASLPHSLTTLLCNHNQLTGLPILPDTLDILICNNNQLTYLPIIPPALTMIDCSYNNIHCFLPFNNSFILLEIKNNPFTCLPNYSSAMDSTTLTYPLCTIGNINGCLSANGITGSTYIDSNNDCYQNTADIILKNIPLRIYDNSNNLLDQSITTTNGDYGFFAQTGNTYRVVIDTLNKPYSASCIYPGLDSVITVGTSGPNINFALKCKPGVDIGVQSIVTNGVIFPGQIHSLSVVAGDMNQWYNLNCTSGSSGTVSFSVNGPVSYIGPAVGSLTPSVFGNIYTYTISDFGTVTNLSDFTLMFQTDTLAAAGSVICVTASVTSSLNDINQLNNTYTYCYITVNSYDPNIKEVYPIDVQPGFNDWLTYTIHFQNTGNAPAYNIRLADTLDAMLDLETFQVINYSHFNNTSVNGNVLNVRFPNIMLPDSTSNPSGSIGYIQYRIKPKATWAAPYKIKNTAYIYFDYNSPIVTNSTYNSILVPTGLNNQTEALAALYPNPTNGTFTIELNSKEKQLLQVFDITGNEVLSQTIENGKSIVDANHLAAGIYNISIKGSSVINKKLVIVR